MAEQDLWQALSDTIHRSVNLRVVTLLGDAVVGGSLLAMDVKAPDKPDSSLVTDINLVGGDITRIVSPKLLGAEYAALRDAHDQAVAQAQQIVARNIGILVSVVKEIGQQLEPLPNPSAGPTR